MAGTGGRTADDPSAFGCPKAAWVDLGTRGHGNLTVTPRCGPNKARRTPRCRTCASRFPDHKGTPLFGARLPPDEVTAVLAHVAGGVGTRKTARLTGVHTDTVTRYARLAGDQAEALHDESAPSSPARG